MSNEAHFIHDFTQCKKPQQEKMALRYVQTYVQNAGKMRSGERIKLLGYQYKQNFKKKFQNIQ